MLDWIFGSKHKKSDADKLPPYEESRDIAAKGSVDKRQWLASRKGLQPEFLYYFATDKEPLVRQAVAANVTTPLQADKILSTDINEDVRAELAQKIARLVPGLDTSRADRVSEMVMEIVTILAQDKVARVRAIVSEEIKTLKNVPQELIEQLAWDAEYGVAMPVLEYSPLLSDRHLLEIIRSGIDGGALSAIARRKKLAKKISKAVADKGDTPSILELLKNNTAKLDDGTFDVIADSSEGSTKILDSLIDREDLTLSTIRRVSSFVGNAVLSKILERHQHRPDINEDAIVDIRQKINNRIKKGGADTATTSETIPGQESRDRAEKLFGDDKLTEDVIIRAIDNAERMFVIHSLALLTNFSWNSVRDVLNSKTAKTVVALAWKAGLTAKTSVHMQTKFCSITGSDIVHPDSSGNFTFSESDMEWYLDFFD